MFTVDNGSDEPIQLVSEHRNVIVALNSKFTLRAMGGSEQFQRKKLHFYKELKTTSLQHESYREIILLQIDRQDILASVSHVLLM